jgi:DNA-binding transcriptional regulator GbsR (MarR family)
MEREEEMLTKLQKLLAEFEELLKNAKAMERKETEYQKLLARYQKLWGQHQALLRKVSYVLKKYRQLLEFLLLEDGLTLEELADILGVSRQRVHQEIKDLGIDLKKRKPEWYTRRKLLQKRHF